jgi:hypothetical protein
MTHLQVESSRRVFCFAFMSIFEKKSNLSAKTRLEIFESNLRDALFASNSSQILTQKRNEASRHFFFQSNVREKISLHFLVKF